MAERLGVNIFSGVLPTSYVFIDDGSDSSKWTNHSAKPWGGISEGDAFGYFGKGLQFEPAHHNPGWAGRWYPLVNLSRLCFGLVVSYSGTVIPAAYGTYPMTVYLRNPLLGVQRELQVKFDIYGPTNVFPIAERISFIGGSTVNVNIVHDAGIFNAGGNTNPVRYWTMVTGIIQGDSLVQVNVNRNVYAPTLVLPAGPDTEGVGQIFVTGLAGTGNASEVTWNVDQIWISDLEYRV